MNYSSNSFQDEEKKLGNNCDGQLNTQTNFQDFDYAYLEDEVRDGFYVPAIMKQFWAAEIETLKMFDAICKKHGLKYFADWGSLLGAVRHGGFIPWDDDLDVLMLREDYMALLKLQDEHPEEFPQGMEVRSFRNREDLLEFHGVVVGYDRISFEPEHLEKFHGFPYIPAIDIFVLDHKSLSPDKQAMMAQNALFVIAFADEICEGMLSGDEIKANLEKIRNMAGAQGVPIDLNKSNTELRIALYDVAETMFASFAEEQGDKLIQNIPWGLLHPESEIPLEYYKEQVILPFEFASIPVPGAYDIMLKQKYRDYLKVVKGVGAHEYPCFSEQERNFKANLDFELPSFKLTEDKVRTIQEQRAENKNNSWKKTVEECIGNMKLLMTNAVNIISAGISVVEKIDEALQNLADMQQLAMDLGQFLENTGRVGEEHIHLLELLCDDIFELYNDIFNCDKAKKLNNDLTNIDTELNGILSREEVVFIPFKKEGFERLNQFFLNENGQENTDVIILEAPYYHKKYDGTIIAENKTNIDFPEDSIVFDYSEYDFEFYHPDRVYIQFPYDNWNPVMTVPNELYAERLVGLTDKLIYVPWFETNDFSDESNTDYVNTQYYVPMPGVVFADEIILNSEEIKKVYIDRLLDFTGLYTSDMWAERIKIIKSTHKEDEFCQATQNGKKIFYYIGISAFLQNPDKIFDKLSANFKIFSDNIQKMEVIVFVDPAIAINLPTLRPQMWKKFEKEIDRWSQEEGFTINSTMTPKDASRICDAYYGDAGRYVRYFVAAKKPVMIQNPEII